MGGQQGSHANRERLKDLNENIKICTSQIRRYKYVREHQDEIFAKYNAEIAKINAKINGVVQDYEDAPQKLIDLRRQLDKFRCEQEKITGHVTGRTKLVAKYKKAKAQLEALKLKLSDSGLDVDNIQTEFDGDNDADTGE